VFLSELQIYAKKLEVQNLSAFLLPSAWFVAENEYLCTVKHELPA
jgi:hypothetical protein